MLSYGVSIEVEKINIKIIKILHERVINFLFIFIHAFEIIFLNHII